MNRDSSARSLTEQIDSQETHVALFNQQSWRTGDTRITEQEIICLFDVDSVFTTSWRQGHVGNCEGFIDHLQVESRTIAIVGCTVPTREMA